MPEFHQTGMGRNFFEGTMRSIAESLEKIAEHLERPWLEREIISMLAKKAVDNMGDVFYNADAFDDSAITNEAIRAHVTKCVADTIEEALAMR